MILRAPYPDVGGTPTPTPTPGTAWTPEANGINLLSVTDPQAASTLSYDATTKRVAAYNSKVGTAVYSQGNDNARMVYSATGINGYPALVASTFAFMVASQIMAGPAPRFAAGVAIVADTTRASSIFSGGGANFQFRGSSGGVLTLNSQSAQAILDTPNGAITAGQPFIYLAYVSGTDAAIRVNGVLAASRTTSISLNGTPQSVVLSASGENGLGAWGGETYGSTIPSLADQQRYEGYYAHRTGLQGLLPANHPYKTAPPTVSA